MGSNKVFSETQKAKTVAIRGEEIVDSVFDAWMFLTPLTEMYIYQRFDSLILENIRLEIGESDVEIVVEHRFFNAHKFILAARSVVFWSMFNSDMEESRTGRVDITDVEETPCGEELGKLAKKYAVSSLAALCNAAKEAEISIGLLTSTTLQSNFDSPLTKQFPLR